MDEIYIIIEGILKQNITNDILISMYYQIGKVIKKKKINTKELELYLKEKYGLVIAFSQRNLNNMTKFSNYNEEQLEKLKKITWKNILVIMKYDDSLINICIKYNPTKLELENYIKTNKKLKQNPNLELDDTLEEIKKLKENMI